MSAKKIAVWGSPGSGKSLVSVALAHSLNAQKQSVIILSFDRTTPMFTTYLPFNKYDDKNGLGALLNETVDKQSLKNRLHFNSNAKDTAFLSFGQNDSVQKYPLVQEFKQEALVSLLSEYADYIICDTSSNFITDKSALFALKSSEIVINLIAPDNGGLAFYDAYLPLLQESISSSQLWLTALSNTFEYSPYKTIKKEQGIEYSLPHSRELYLSYLSGELLTKARDEQGIQFNITVANMIERIVMQNERAERTEQTEREV